ncbi:MAG: hypothetical protein AAFR66_12080 [Bacteroidota bacterium]
MKKRSFLFIAIFIGVFSIGILTKLGALDPYSSTSMSTAIRLNALEQENYELRSQLAAIESSNQSLYLSSQQWADYGNALRFKLDSLAQEYYAVANLLAQCENQVNRSTQPFNPGIPRGGDPYYSPPPEYRGFNLSPAETCGLLVDEGSLQRYTFNLNTLQPLTYQAWGIQLFSSSSACGVVESFEAYNKSFPSMQFFIRYKPQTGTYCLVMGQYESKGKANRSRNSLKKSYPNNLPSGMFAVAI